MKNIVIFTAIFIVIAINQHAEISSKHIAVYAIGIVLVLSHNVIHARKLH